MPTLVMLRLQGGPTSIRFHPSWREEKTQVHLTAGHEFVVPDGEVDHWLAYSHRCEDGHARPLFARPESRTLQGQTAELQGLGEVLQAVIEAGLSSGMLTEEQADKLKGRLPAVVEAEVTAEPVVCDSCKERVRARPGDERCPHCNGMLRSPVGVITTEQLPDRQRTKKRVNPWRCELCNFEPPEGVDPAKSLRMHVMKKHADG